jgi:hypothetical protein
MTQDQLLAKAKQIEDDPANRETEPGSLYLYNKAARKRLDAIRREIVDQQIARQKAAGTYVFPGGYSGRQTNKR